MRTILLLMIGLSSLSHAEFIRENGIVTDINTRLEWQDDYSDNGGDIKTTATWTDAIDYCEALNLNGQNWRLPNINELKSLIEDTPVDKNLYYLPYIDLVFEHTKYSYNYWSSTYDHFGGRTWVINYRNGTVTNINGTDTGIPYIFVRCVREGTGYFEGDYDYRY